ncbi:MAG: hypothetical protein IJG09_04200 [Methanobrevibacter sp.]|nr:hypothetical protein [Methanobrevibacter sp.]
MSLLDEYGENKFEQGIEQGFEQGEENIIVKILKSGENPETIALKTEVSLDRILEIKEKHNL